MSNLNANLRKAAIFIRSLDAETAAAMLGQMTPDEAAALRAAMREVGSVDAAERDDVASEFRRARPAAAETVADGVELALSSSSESPSANFAATLEAPRVAATVPMTTRSKPFEFLEHAPIERLIPFLAREHAQTIAVVLSHLAPARAAAVMAGLPHKLQGEALERLAALGETDPESIVVVERELAAWLADRTMGRRGGARRNDAALAILAATDAATRDRLLASLRAHNAPLASQLSPPIATPAGQPHRASLQRGATERRERATQYSHQAAACAQRLATASAGSRPDLSHEFAPQRRTAPLPLPLPPLPPTMPFDELIQLEKRTLAAVVRELDASILVLALAGSKDELVRYICDQLPRRMSRELRRELRQLRPTRLSDVEAAQLAVSRAAARHLAQRRTQPLAATA